MADRDKPTDIDKLLAEVDGMLEPGTGSRSKPARAVVPAEEESGGLTDRVRTAAVAGVVGGGVVWVLFALLPFLGAFSGAAGASLATFFAVLLLRRR